MYDTEGNTHHKMGGPSVKLPLISWLSIIPFHQTFSLKNVYVKNSFDISINFFMIHKMCMAVCVQY